MSNNSEKLVSSSVDLIYFHAHILSFHTACARSGYYISHSPKYSLHS
jgi:hypothetical protein